MGAATRCWVQHYAGSGMLAMLERAMRRRVAAEKMPKKRIAALG